jgi:hypothetical protein
MPAKIRLASLAMTIFAEFKKSDAPGRVVAAAGQARLRR